MEMLTTIYRSGLALLTDLYQLTMAYGYWKQGKADQEAVFHLHFRRPPFGGGFAVTAGLGPALEFVQAFRFEPSDVEFLASLTGHDGEALFESEFLHYLGQLRLSCQIDAMPEGTVAFVQEPILRVRGTILQCQLLETALLNIVNFQTLIATKAARIRAAARGEPVIEFGLRRAQGIDGALAASRAAYIGGCEATSNVLAGKLYGIPVRGTHAHSWVMSFESELEAFDAYAAVLPNNCVFLVDTYDTLEGVRHAITVGRKLRKAGQELLGIRLDSGDLAHLSIEARKLLDEAGFESAQIMATNDLDEHIIESLKHQGATIAVWGVGTRLVTGYDQPALGGVYKLGALRNQNDQWESKIKLSEQIAKTTIPGILQVRRFSNSDGFTADMIYDETRGVDSANMIVDVKDATRRKSIPDNDTGRDLLVPVVRDGKIIGNSESLDAVRNRVGEQLTALHPGIRRFLNPHEYPVGIEQGLHALRDRMIQEARARTASSSSD